MDNYSKLLIAEDALQRVRRLGCVGVQSIAKEALRRIGTLDGAVSSVDWSVGPLDAPGSILSFGDTQGSTQAQNGSNGL
jgi:hypothetical protein